MGQSAARPRSTSGSVDSSTSSGSARRFAPATSWMRSALSGIEPARTIDHSAEIRQRGNHHEQRLQMSLAVQFAECLGAERLQAVFLDGVEAGELLLAPIAESDVEREPFQQVELLERRNERLNRCDAFVDGREQGNLAHQELGVRAVLVEQTLALGAAHPRAVEIDVDDLAVGRLPDEERLVLRKDR